MVSELDEHKWLIALEDDPTRGCMWAVRPAALIGLKEQAFGRTRPSGETVDRDSATRSSSWTGSESRSQRNSLPLRRCAAEFSGPQRL